MLSHAMQEGSSAASSSEPSAYTAEDLVCPDRGIAWELMELLRVITQEPLSAGTVQHFVGVIFSFLP